MKQPVLQNNTNTQDVRSATHAAQHQTPSTGAPSGHLAQLAAMANRSPQVHAQLKRAEELRNSSEVESQLDLAAELNDSGEAAQLKLKITSESGTFTYKFGKDFKRDHIGTAADGIATLKQRWQDYEDASPVTTIAELDGNLDATEVKAKSPYNFALQMDVDGNMASWNDRHQPVTVAVDSVVLSGYNTGPNSGLITHISSSN
jgi:hypothetical protein